MTKKVIRGFTTREEDGILVDYHHNLTESEALHRLKRPGVTLIEAPEGWIPPSELEPDKLQGTVRDLRGI